MDQNAVGNFRFRRRIQGVLLWGRFQPKGGLPPQLVTLIRLWSLRLTTLGPFLPALRLTPVADRESPVTRVFMAVIVNTRGG